MRNERALVHVDDDPLVTRLVADRFLQQGFRVTAYHDPCDFLAQLPRRCERVVLLDVDLPRMNGLEVLQRIKAFDGGIQVIMLTGMVSMHSVLESLRRGAEACFFKPLADFQPLFSAVTCCFRKLERWWEALEELSCRRNVEPADLHVAIRAIARDSEFCRQSARRSSSILPPATTPALHATTTITTCCPEALCVQGPSAH